MLFHLYPRCAQYDKVCQYNKKKALYKKYLWILRLKPQYDNKEVSMTILYDKASRYDKENLTKIPNFHRTE